MSRTVAFIGLGYTGAPMAAHLVKAGGVVGAETATLTFMARGVEAEFTEARPLLEAMGKKAVHCGGPGAGQGSRRRPGPRS